jgi:acyl dehydratase
MDLNAVTTKVFPVLDFEYTAKDTILYALGVGAGSEWLSPEHLPFVYEKTLKIIPSQSSVIAFPGAWMTYPEFGINYLKVLHGEQGVIFERPLKPTAKVRGEYEVLGVDDKGAGKAAIIFFEKRIIDAEDGGLICKVRSTYFLRGDGGSGSWGTPLEAPAALPDRAPDQVIDTPTIERQALIYRLSGDYNPVHIDPETAKNAGFDKPILHGLGSYGVACFAIVQKYCGGNPDLLKEFFVRFSKVVFPGDTIRLEVFEEGNGVLRFRARALERDEVVLDRGLARIG